MENAMKRIIDGCNMKPKEFADTFGIKFRTVQDWYYGNSKPPEYVLKFIEYYLTHEGYLKQ